MFLAPHIQHYIGELQVEKKIVEGNPADEILKAGSGMDAIIIGSIGRTGQDRFLLGSVAERVVRNSRVPVLVVHGDGSGRYRLSHRPFSVAAGRIFAYSMQKI